MLPSPPSRPRGASSLWTGVLLDSRWESTTSPRLLFLEETWLRFSELSVCCLTPLLSLRLGPGLTTSLTLCMQSVPLSTGMWVRVWRRESSLRPEETSIRQLFDFTSTDFVLLILIMVGG